MRRISCLQQRRKQNQLMMCAPHWKFDVFEIQLKIEKSMTSNQTDSENRNKFDANDRLITAKMKYVFSLLVSAPDFWRKKKLSANRIYSDKWEITNFSYCARYVRFRMWIMTAAIFVIFPLVTRLALVRYARRLHVLFLSLL